MNKGGNSSQRTTARRGGLLGAMAALVTMGMKGGAALIESAKGMLGVSGDRERGGSDSPYGGGYTSSNQGRGKHRHGHYSVSYTGRSKARVRFHPVGLAFNIKFGSRMQMLNGRALENYFLQVQRRHGVERANRERERAALGQAA
jgi:hypothetical protein